MDDQQHDRGRRRALMGLAGAMTGMTAVREARAAVPLRSAVVGGIDRCGVWPRLAERAARATGLDIVTEAVAPKEALLPMFRDGRADVMLIHGGDEVFSLASEGWVGALSVWGFNDHVIVGPEDDPAGIGGMTDGIAAMRRLRDGRHAFVAFRDPGSHGIVQRLWRLGGITPSVDWVQLDAAENPHEVLAFAAERGAHVVVGRIPVLTGKRSLVGQRMLVAGDPAMRRAYVAAPPGPDHPASAQTRDAAARFVAFLVSPQGQQALVAADADAGGPWLFPLDRTVRAFPRS